MNPPRLVKLEYAPKGASQHLAIVGKGITFDSGGISIKPADGMEEMKMDKNGAIAVIEAAATIAQMFDADFAFQKWYSIDLPYTAQLTKDNPSAVPVTWLGPVNADETIESYVRPGCGCVAEASAQV